MKKILDKIYKWLLKTEFSIILFWPLAVFYYFFFILRKSLYKAGLRKSQSLPCQIISVGNITLGGTGKTPLVEFIARKLKFKRIVILSRGYGRKGARKKILLVSDKARVLAGVKEAGDESYLLARKLPGVPVIVGGRRYFNGKWAIQRFQPEVIILDDGFQHWSLKRNVDLVVIDSTNPFGNRWLIPAGILREPLGELKRANLIFLSKVNEGNVQVDVLKKKIRKFNSLAPVVETIYEPVEFSLWPKKEIRTKDCIYKKPIFMLASLGAPSSFRYSLLQLGGKLVGEAIYPDHYYYQAKDLADVMNLARFKKAEFIVTTEKDEVRLPEVSVDFPILILKVELKVVVGGEILDAWLS